MSLYMSEIYLENTVYTQSILKEDYNFVRRRLERFSKKSEVLFTKTEDDVRQQGFPIDEAKRLVKRRAILFAPKFKTLIVNGEYNLAVSSLKDETKTISEIISEILHIDKEKIIPALRLSSISLLLESFFSIVLVILYKYKVISRHAFTIANAIFGAIVREKVNAYSIKQGLDGTYLRVTGIHRICSGIFPSLIFGKPVFNIGIQTSSAIMLHFTMFIQKSFW